MYKERFKELSTQALRDKNPEMRKIMGNILSRFLEVEKSGQFGGWTPQTEEDTVRAYLKSLQKSLDTLPDGEIAASYRKEIELLTAFLPKALSEEETRALITPYVANAKGLGPFVGAVLKEHRGKVDPDMVKRLGIEMGLK